MAQNDFTIDNQSFPATRADINSAIQALATLSSGATAPTTPFANQFWMDTTTDPYVLKIRNSANNQWITVAEVNQGSVYFAITAYLFATSGTVTAPSISFTGDRDTGLYSVGANTIGVATNGTLRYQVGPNGELGVGSNYGTSGQFLKSNGSGSAPAWTTEPITTYTLSGTGTWTKPSSGTFALVRMWGGGGSGGHGGGTANRAAGGGGGAYGEVLYLLSSLGATESYSVGSGGAAVTAGGSGNSGSNTTFRSGANLFTVYGGGGGEGNKTSPGGGQGGGLWSAGTQISGSTVSSNGDQWTGADGGGNPSPYNGANGWYGGGGGGAGISSNPAGTGGSSYGGGKGGDGSISGNASNGSFPAGGGGGCGNTSASFSSGAGGDGSIQIYIW